MKKKIFLLQAIMFIYSCTLLHAQTSILDSTKYVLKHKIKPKPKDFSNSLSIGGSNFHIPQEFIFMFRFPMPSATNDQVSAYFEKRIYKNWHIMLGYNEWNTLPIYIDNHGYGEVASIDSMQVGLLEYRSRYKMIDCYLLYIFNNFTKHKIKLGMGISYAVGFNMYINSISAYPGYYDLIITLRAKYENYLGVVPTLSYDYLFLRNRIAIGADIKYRQYFGLKDIQIDYGWHLAFNF